MARRKRYKQRVYTGMLEDVLGETAAFDVEELGEEMSSWAESLEGAGMDHMPKYDEVTEAAETLKEGARALQDALGNADLDPESDGYVGNIEVAWTEVSPYGRKPEPRWMRLANAIAPLQAVCDSFDGDHEPEWVDEIRSALGDMEAVDFPSMY